MHMNDMNTVPSGRASVALPGDASSGVVELLPLSAVPVACSNSIRWMGAGAATLYYQPATPRAAGNMTTSEVAAGLPVSFSDRQWLSLSFLSQGEEQPVQAVALLSDDGVGHASTAGTYVVAFT